MLTGRLFTFGCSFTDYRWPTWADMCGNSFNHYQNWGLSGAGNFYIFQKLLECHKINKITENDTVLVMFSSVPRNDVYREKRGWQIRGNILTTLPHMSSEEYLYYTQYWNLTHAYSQTWTYVQGVKYLLDLIGCKYKLMKAFSLSPDMPSEYRSHLPMDSTQFYPYYVDVIKEILPEISVFEWMDLNFYNQHYEFKNGVRDMHPTIKQHALWCKEFLSEYYIIPVDIDALEAQMCWDTLECNNQKFVGVKQNQIKGILH